AREGGSWHVQASLAQTGRWLWDLGRVAGGLDTRDLTGDAVTPFIEEVGSGFGALRAVRHSAILSKPRHFGPVRRCRSAAIRRNGRHANEAVICRSAFLLQTLTSRPSQFSFFRLCKMPFGHY